MAAAKKRLTFKTLDEFKRKLNALPTRPSGRPCQLVRTGTGVVCRGSCRPGFECLLVLTSNGLTCKCARAD
jgi:hypothetical protein